MSAPRLTPLPASGFRRTPWKNGGGVSTDIADCYRPDAAPADWDGVIWRLGRTQIVTPGPFSDLAGYERLQVVIAGRGLVLVTPGSDIDLRELHQPVRYDGGTPIVTRLEHGPVEVVNLIADRALCEIALVVLRPGDLTDMRPGLHLLYALDGTATGDAGGEAYAIETGDALRIETDEPCRLLLGAGLALCATIIRRDA